jgi:hypothetical protein
MMGYQIMKYIQSLGDEKQMNWALSMFQFTTCCGAGRGWWTVEPRKFHAALLSWFFFFLDGAGGLTQGLGLARQVLYSLSHSASQLSYFLKSVNCKQLKTGEGEFSVRFPLALLWVELSRSTSARGRVEGQKMKRDPTQEKQRIKSKTL